MLAIDRSELFCHFLSLPATLGPILPLMSDRDCLLLPAGFEGGSGEGSDFHLKNDEILQLTV